VERDYRIYEDIAQRTNGDIYIGVVGPVRTGKSLLLKSLWMVWLSQTFKTNMNAREQ
jgi:ABC-type transporter Mla maintaining outer membrane lipid asymmetry ATPase subunit MlaF